MYSCTGPGDDAVKAGSTGRANICAMHNGSRTQT